MLWWWRRGVLVQKQAVPVMNQSKRGRFMNLLAGGGCRALDSMDDDSSVLGWFGSDLARPGQSRVWARLCSGVGSLVQLSNGFWSSFCPARFGCYLGFGWSPVKPGSKFSKLVIPSQLSQNLGQHAVNSVNTQKREKVLQREREGARCPPTTLPAREGHRLRVLVTANMVVVIVCLKMERDKTKSGVWLRYNDLVRRCGSGAGCDGDYDGRTRPAPSGRVSLEGPGLTEKYGEEGRGDKGVDSAFGNVIHGFGQRRPTHLTGWLTATNCEKECRRGLVQCSHLKIQT
ncbi:hypothetical protein M8C21_028082 [Ambrosia artemisiifolia]|uniref:Uncharacterized protein n=1 Tax=Ambrosia artemisiifolia TaxID=4212 RepID=A0AAD5D4Z6_AMBAR|nr:hypothetical protein M8C21_028082 [Ambrosia artemisiifolia]